MTRIWKNCLILTAVLLVAGLSGCTAGPAEQTEDLEDSLPERRISWALNRPLVIEDAEDQTILLEAHWDQTWPGGCPQQRVEFNTVMIYDRFGKHDQLILPMDRSQDPNVFSVELTGESPWVVVGEMAVCINPNYMFWVGNFTGFTAYRDEANSENGFKRPTAWDNITVRVPQGQSTAKTDFRFDEFAYQWIGAAPGAREGNNYGVFSLHDDQGRMIFWQERRVWSGQNLSYQNWQMSYAPYTANLELDTPALEDTAWSFAVRYRFFGDEACAWGVE